MEVLRMKKVGIVMGSDSDLPIAEKAVGVLLELGIPSRYTCIPRTEHPLWRQSLPAERRSAASALLSR